MAKGIDSLFSKTVVRNKRYRRNHAVSCVQQLLTQFSHSVMNGPTIALLQLVRFEVFTAVRIMMMMIFWVLAPCRLVGRYQRFGDTYCLHLQGAKKQKNIIIKYYSLFSICNVIILFLWHASGTPEVPSNGLEKWHVETAEITVFTVVIDVI
jgi:hypothetical protein